MRMRKIDIDARRQRESGMICHFRPLVPGQRLHQLGWEISDGLDQCDPHLISGTAEGKRDNCREPARALDQRSRRRCPVLAHNEITLPMPGNLTVCYLFRPVLNGTHAHDPGTRRFPAPAGLSPLTARPQLDAQAAELTFRQGVHPGVNRLVRHHVPSMPAGSVVFQPPGHLIGGISEPQTGHHPLPQGWVSVHLPVFWAASLLLRPRLRPVRPVFLPAAIPGELPAYDRLRKLVIGRDLLVRQAYRQTARYLLTILRRQRPAHSPQRTPRNHQVRRDSQQKRSPTGRRRYLREDHTLPNGPIAFTPCDQGLLARNLE